MLAWRPLGRLLEPQGGIVPGGPPLMQTLLPGETWICHKGGGTFACRQPALCMTRAACQGQSEDAGPR